jgi:hypothetical protein
VAQKRALLEAKLHEACTAVPSHGDTALALEQKTEETLPNEQEIIACIQRTATTASSTNSSLRSHVTIDSDESSQPSSTTTGSSSSSLHDSVDTCRTLLVLRQKFISPTTECIYLYSGPVRAVTDPTQPGRIKLIPHGDRGEVWYSPGHHYKGGMQFGFRHGQGEFTWVARKNGSVTTLQTYRGMWEHDHRHGLGTVTVKRFTEHNSNVETVQTVVGTWKLGRMHGRISLTVKDGSHFDGSVVQGKRQGRGTETFRNGKEYSGQYKNDLPDGHGTLKEGDRLYRGQFKQGKRQFYGVQVWPHRLYDGEWKDNAMHGRGKLAWTNGACYSGHFANGRFHGQGCYTDGKGNRFVGNWVRGYKQGEGKEYDTRGNVFTGGFHKGHRHGYGRVMYADGGSYSGGWRRGKRWGPGMLIRGDGSVEHCGLFENDEAVFKTKTKQLETRDDLDITSRADDEDEASKHTTRDIGVMTELTEDFLECSEGKSTRMSMFFI